MHRLIAAAPALLLLAAATGCTNNADPSVASEGPSPELVAAQEAVSDAAPRLESLYRVDIYPETLDEVLATLDDANMRVDAPLSVAGYRYDPDAVEFVLCVEHASGAWATYDTAPMALQQGGEDGGCPDLG